MIGRQKLSNPTPDFEIYQYIWMRIILRTMKLLVLAGGTGSRFGGIKQLASVGGAGETLLEYNIYNALSAGFDGIVFLIRRETEGDFRDRILARLPGGISVEFAYQDMLSQVPAEVSGELEAWLQGGGRKKPWGTGHALLCAQRCLEGGASPGEAAGDGAFAVVNADDFYGKRAFVAIRDFFAAPAGRRRGTDGSSRGARKAGPDSAAAGPGAAIEGFDTGASAAGSRFCLAAYGLDSVVPRHGSVSRALCTLDAGRTLVKVTEHVRIERADGHIVSRQTDGSTLALDPLAPVSMNIWGLDRGVFSKARALFGAFMANPENWAKGEFYLPAVVDSMIDEGSATVTALPVTEQYFGLTNPEDLADTRGHIAALTAQGIYPSPLWKDFEEAR